MAAMTPTRRPRFVTVLWAAVALLTALNAAAWWQQRRSSVEAELASTLRAAEIANDAFAEETLQMFRQIDLVLRGIRAFHRHSGSVAATEAYIHDLRLGGARIENGYLVDAAGRLAITHTPSTVGRSVADRDYFRFHQATADDLPYVSRVELGRATGRYLFRVTRRIDDAQGRFAGVSLVTVEPSAIADFYARLTQRDGSVANLISVRDHRLRARVPEPTVEVWERPLDTPLWAHLAASPTGRYTAPGAVDGVLRHYVYRAIPEWDMVMLSGVPDAQIRARADEGFARTSLAMGGSNLVLIVLALALTVVDRQRQRLRELANTDALTGLPNRRALWAQGEHELSRAERYQRPYSVLLLDVDHFKRVNDQFGHASGDRVLRALADCGTRALRDTDLFGRFGGEEFLVLLPETDAAGALLLAERIRESVARCPQGLDDLKRPIPFTVSIGVAGRATPEEAMAAMVTRAEAALHRAKALGHNRVELEPATGA